MNYYQTILQILLIQKIKNEKIFIHLLLSLPVIDF